MNLLRDMLDVKGHLLWKIHFYMVFEHKCVLAVCEQNHPRMIKIHPVAFFTILINHMHRLRTNCSKIQHFVT